MYYAVRGRAECVNCPAQGREKKRVLFIENVIAENEEAAKDAFLRTSRLCRDCDYDGIKANFQFDRQQLVCECLGSSPSSLE